MTDLFEIIEKVKSIKVFSKEAVEKATGAKIKPREDANRFYAFYRGEALSGPFTTIEYVEPREGAKKREFRVVMTLKSGVVIGLDDIEKRYGRGEIGQIIPDAKPEGIVSYRYKEQTQIVVFQLTAISKKLINVIITREI